jgi:hypothetical protein
MNGYGPPGQNRRPEPPRTDHCRGFCLLFTVTTVDGGSCFYGALGGSGAALTAETPPLPVKRVPICDVGAHGGNGLDARFEATIKVLV